MAAVNSDLLKKMETSAKERETRVAQRQRNKRSFESEKGRSKVNRTNYSAFGPNGLLKGHYNASFKSFGRRDWVRAKGTTKSALAVAAYRMGLSLTDERTSITYDYSKRKGVISATTYLPDGASSQYLEPSKLWNAAEAAAGDSTRLNTSHEFQLSLPHELSKEDMQQLVDEYCEHLVKKYGVGVSASMHSPKERDSAKVNNESSSKNYHVHILMTTRRIGPYGLEGMQIPDFSLRDEKLIPKHEELLRREVKTGNQRIAEERTKWAELINKKYMELDMGIEVTAESNLRSGLKLERKHNLTLAESKAAMRASKNEEDMPHRAEINNLINEKNERQIELLNLIHNMPAKPGSNDMHSKNSFQKQLAEGREEYARELAGLLTPEELKRRCEAISKGAANLKENEWHKAPADKAKRELFPAQMSQRDKLVAQSKQLKIEKEKAEEAGDKRALNTIDKQWKEREAQQKEIDSFLNNRENRQRTQKLVDQFRAENETTKRLRGIAVEQAMTFNRAYNIAINFDRYREDERTRRLAIGIAKERIQKTVRANVSLNRTSAETEQITAEYRSEQKEEKRDDEPVIRASLSIAVQKPVFDEPIAGKKKPNIKPKGYDPSAPADLNHLPAPTLQRDDEYRAVAEKIIANAKKPLTNEQLDRTVATELLYGKKSDGQIKNTLLAGPVRFDRDPEGRAEKIMFDVKLEYEKAFRSINKLQGRIYRGKLMGIYKNAKGEDVLHLRQRADDTSMNYAVPVSEISNTREFPENRNIALICNNDGGWDLFEDADRHLQGRQYELAELWRKHR